MNRTSDNTLEEYQRLSPSVRNAIAEHNLNVLIDGDVNSVQWRAAMRRLLERVSPGPFDVSTGDPQFDPEPMAVVTNPARAVLAKCGPYKDAPSVFDAIAFAASVNAIRALLDPAADALTERERRMIERMRTEHADFGCPSDPKRRAFCEAEPCQTLTLVQLIDRIAPKPAGDAH